MTYLDSWLEEIETTVSQFPLVFLQLGAAFPSAQVAVRDSIFESMSLDSYLASEPGSSPVIVVTDLDAVVTDGLVTNGLGELRGRVLSDLGRGVRVVLQSRLPRMAYPDVPGSSLLEDAVFAAGPDFQGWTQPGEAPTFEATLGGQVPSSIVIRDALVELGPAICATLDRVIFEEMNFASATLGALADREMEALRGAGLLVARDGTYTWSLPGGEAALRDALEDALYAFPQGSTIAAETTEKLRSSERAIRKALRARSRVLWGGGWKAEVVPAELVNTVLARAASSYPHAMFVGELRDPLEWLTMPELLDIRQKPEIGGLGLREVVWERMRGELIPVRERAAYFRPIQRVDADIADKWWRLLEPRLSSTGELTDVNAQVGAEPTLTEIVDRVKVSLSENPAYQGEVGAHFLALVRDSVRFLARTYDHALEYTALISNLPRTPLESDLQKHFYWFLDASAFSGRVYMEVPNVGTGRADVVAHLDSGIRLVVEVKRELADASRDSIDGSYLAQTLEYQSGSVPLGQLLVLDLTDHTQGVSPIAESVWVTHRRNEQGQVIQTAVVVVVQGNRARPSALSR